MSSETIPVTAAGARSNSRASARRQRYRHAERALWEHYGLAPTECFVELGAPAARLRVLEVGAGEPLLFVHGTAGAGPVWAPLVRELGDFRCLLLDRPGWGLSSAVDFSRHEYGAVVADVLSGVLDGLGIERAHVVGGSIGDVWALRLAARHPSRVDRIALLGGGPLLPEVPVPPIIRLIASPAGAMMVRLRMGPDRVQSILRQVGHGSSLDAGRIPDVFVEWRAVLGSDTDSMRHERAMVRAIVDWRRGFRPGLAFDHEELAALPTPTLLVQGTADPTGSPDIWQRFVDLLPRGELRLVEDAGHMPWLDDPSGLATGIRRFLAAGTD
jgi:pimeloyl-ACP methyl ester carboxylesterase